MIVLHGSPQQPQPCRLSSVDISRNGGGGGGVVLGGALALALAFSGNADGFCCC